MPFNSRSKPPDSRQPFVQRVLPQFSHCGRHLIFDVLPRLVGYVYDFTPGRVVVIKFFDVIELFYFFGHCCLMR